MQSLGSVDGLRELWLGSKRRQPSRALDASLRLGSKDLSVPGQRRARRASGMPDESGEMNVVRSVKWCRLEIRLYLKDILERV